VKIAVLGDIHGNALALTAVLAAAAREQVEALCITGDFVGYYYQPREVLALLEPWPSYRVRGNHEDMLERAEQEPAFLEECTGRYGSGLAVALDSLSFVQRRALVALPRSLRIELDGCRILLAHGSPWSTDEYVYPDAPPAKWESLSALDADVVLYGHTHYRVARRVNETLVINPGSVGQPRDGMPGAAWALLDTARASADLRTETYDIDAVCAQAGQHDPSMSYLREVLHRT
jgi:putative phosphoesterase